MTELLPLDAPEARRSDLCGTKAARLAELASAGFPVPDGFVVTTAAFGRAVELAGAPPAEAVPPTDLETRIRDEVAAFGGAALAVRSSGVDEDREDASFAGQYETVLDVREPADVVSAVRICWASAFSSRVVAYRDGRGREAQPLGVLVQRLVRARSAGVAFSAHPLTGRRDQVVVNAVTGLGETLVGGEATADEWVIEGDTTEPVRLIEHAITAAEAREVAALARRVEEHYGCPQDIEWAYEGDALWLLQARPITALPGDVAWEPPEPGIWLRAFRLGEWLGDPITPLFETWLLARLERRLFNRFERVLPVPTPRPYHVTIHGWYFTTGNFVPRSVWQALWLMVRFVLPALFRNATAMGIATTRYAHRAMRKFEAEWRGGPREAYARAVAEAEQRVESARAGELVRTIDVLADLAGDELFYFFVIGGSAWKVEARLAIFYARHVHPSTGGSYQELLQGLGIDSGGQAHVALGVDWMHPTLGELGLPGSDGAAAKRNQAASRREAAVQRARSALPDNLARRFDELLELAQHFGRVREEQAARLTLAWPVLRRAVRRLGDIAQRHGVLESADDVYFITRGELTDAVACPRDPLDTAVRERRSAWQGQRRLVPPLQAGSMSPLQSRIYTSIEQPFAASQSENGGLRGLPASPGRATGRVRIVRTYAEFASLEPGEILVAPATSPGWTPLFARASAVVTDTGSIMAHASLVAREYAIPSVVGTGDATRRLRDGQLVTVDGSEGRVVVH